MTTINYNGIEIHVDRFGKVFWMSQWEKLADLKNDGIIYWTWPSRNAQEPDIFPTQKGLSFAVVEV